MNLKSQLSIGFGSPCSRQNNAVPRAAEKARALTDHHNISGRYLLEKDKWLEASHCFLSNQLEKRKREKNKKYCNCFLFKQT